MKAWMNMLVIVAMWAGAGLHAAEVSLVKVQGAIGPATASYLTRAIKVAEQRESACLVIQLDTPGGLVSLTEDIVKDFYSARVPIIVYVAPSGAAATSAGTFITMAADIAVMAPHTRIGAAHPVSMGLGGGNEGTNDIMRAKAENDVATFVRTIAEKRGRNVTWAESAVRTSVSISAEEALTNNVIDLIATNMTDLLRQIDGREVGGKKLATIGAAVAPIKMLPSESLFHLLWRPEVLMILMLAAIYGIIAELNTPGAILPGVVGAIALVLVLYMSAILPVNYAGFAFIGLAVALFIVDVFAPTHGVLTGGGIISFFLGLLMLFHHAGPAFKLSLPYIIAATLLTAAFFIFVVGAGLRAQRLPVQSGRETMLGKVVLALDRIDAASGKVFIEGELWNAVSDVPVEKDHPVEVVAITGLTLKVKPKQK